MFRYEFCRSPSVSRCCVGFKRRLNSRTALYAFSCSRTSSMLTAPYTYMICSACGCGEHSLDNYYRSKSQYWSLEEMELK